MVILGVVFDAKREQVDYQFELTSGGGADTNSAPAIEQALKLKRGLRRNRVRAFVK